MSDAVAPWFEARTARAPQRLRQRAADAIAMTSHEVDLVMHLAGAGANALESATAAGHHRTAALDLLAADALITLALLAAAEENPATLGQTARALRLEAGQ